MNNKDYWNESTFDRDNRSEKICRTYDRLSIYVKEFLCSPHPHRKGAVCPFVPPSLAKDSIYYTYHPDSEHIKKPKEAIKFVYESLEYYLNKIRVENNFASLIIFFHEDFDTKQLLKIQAICKKKFVINDAMIGALYPYSTAPSLHSKSYFPLRTPIPTLVIRDMVSTDLDFLTQKKINISNKIIFLSKFIKKFKDSKSNNVILKVKIAEKHIDTYLKINIKRKIITGAVSTAFIILLAALYVF